MNITQPNTNIIQPQLTGKTYNAKAAELGKEFESFYLYSMLEQMSEGIEGSEIFGGGHAEKVFKGFLHEHMADAMAKQGGIGLADTIERQLLKYQEVR